MIATEVRSIVRDTMVESVLRHIFFFCALVSGFVTFPTAKAFVAFCLLFIASIADSLLNALKLQEIQQKRFQWMLELGNRIGVTNLYNKRFLEGDAYIENDDFWRESQKEATDDIKKEDGVAIASEDLDAELNPLLKARVSLSVLFSLLFNFVIVLVAFFAAKFIANIWVS